MSRRFKAHPVHFGIVNSRGRIIYTTGAPPGMTTEDVVGETPWSFADPIDRDKLHAAFAKAILSRERHTIRVLDGLGVSSLRHWDLKLIPLESATMMVELWPNEGALRDVITPRELDILFAICDGLVAKQIAKRLNIAATTVQTHRGSLLHKTRSNGNAQLALWAVRHGIFQP